ncbi:hypothetical protein R0K17_20690, partial [Planococcus sp. SIMBA_143]
MNIKRFTKRISMGAIALLCAAGVALPASANENDMLKQNPEGAYVPSVTPDLSKLHDKPFSMNGKKKNEHALGPAAP